MRRHAKAPSAGSSHGTATRAALLLVLALILSLALAASALGATKGQISAFGSAGSGNGQFGTDSSSSTNGPQGIAVNQTGSGGAGAGDVYVVDSSNNRVERFNADGTYIGSFGSAGSGNGQFSGPQGIAIDQSSGDVYVTDGGNFRVEKFTAEGSFLRAWGWGVLDGGDSFQICDNLQSCRAGSPGAGGGQFDSSFGSASRPTVDSSTGEIYVSDPANRRIQVFGSSGNFLRAFGWDVVPPGGPGEVESPLNERQQVSLCSFFCFPGAAVGGTFTLSFESQTTAAMPYNASAAEVGTALEGLSSVGAGNVSVSGPAGGTWTVEFTGALGGTNVADITGDGSNLAGIFGPASVSVSTETQGGPAPGFEVCTSACQRGSTDSGAQNGRFGFGAPTYLAIDAAGPTHVLFASDSNANNRVQRIDITDPAVAAPIGPIDSPPLLNAVTSGLAVDPASGHLLVARDPAEASAETVIQEVTDPTNTSAPLPAVSDEHASGEGWIGGTEAASAGLVGDIATRGSSGRIYVSRPGAHQVAILNAPGTAATATDPTVADNTAGTSVSLGATVDPHGSLTVYRFEYRLCPGGVCGSGAFTSLPSPDASAGSGTGSVNVSQSITGLTPGATYEVQLVVDGFGPPAVTALVPFTTPTIPPVITTRPAAPVTDTTADLQAEINPNDSATEYHFEWGAQDCSSNPCTSVPSPDATIPAGHEGVVVTESLQGLSPATTYHFRILADNGTGGEQSGGDQTFTTHATPTTPPADACPNAALRTGPSAGLPDCRAYEMVSPADKPGGQGVGQYKPGDDSNAVPGLAAVQGNRYISSVFAGNLTPGEALYAVDYALSERTAGGWVSHSPYTHHNYAPTGGNAAFLDLTAASADLSTQSWGAVGGASDLFPEQASWSVLSSYLTDWQGRWELVAPKAPTVDARHFEGWNHVSADGSHVVLQALSGQLGPTDPTLDQDSDVGLYEYAVSSAGLSDQFVPNGELRPVGICTGGGGDRTLVPVRDGGGKLGAQACPPPAVGRDAALVSRGGASIARRLFGALSTKNALSADGKRIFFHSPDPGLESTPTACTGTGQATACPPQLYLRQTDAAGNPIVRWVSRSQVPGQDASLMGSALYEGASTSGSKVFFRSRSPLTADDPNATGSAPVTSGSPNSDSWDLYRYDVPSDAAGHPNGEDPGGGSLTRISAGPLGSGDCNVSESSTQGAGLRFASDDGSRVYFVCSGPLPGVPTNTAPSDGTITSAGGAPTSGITKNLYLYDATKPLAQRWEFIARLPNDFEAAFANCASENAVERQPIAISGNGTFLGDNLGNCFKGSADGKFVTFMTPGRLVSGDPDSSSVDIYAFDAEADSLIRIDAPQGGPGGTYGCLGPVASPTGQCFADEGFTSEIAVLPGVATDPSIPGDRIAFFQSKSRLVPEDTNDQYDVYEWRNGKLLLLSASTGAKGSYYAGNSASGRDVFIETPDRLSWQDVDGVMDIYDARAGGGFAEPPPPSPGCDVLSDSCQPGSGPAPTASAPGSASFSGSGNKTEPPKSKKCRQGSVRRHGKCVKKRHRKHQQRASHDRRPHR